MRTLTCVAAILLLAGAVMAADNPVDKGSMILGGTAYFTGQSGDWYENADGDGVTTIGFVPSVGYFIAPSIMIGGEIQFINWSQGDYKTTTFGIGPAVGYYFNLDATRTEAKGAIYPYIKGFFIYGQRKDDDGTNEATTDLMAFGAQGGGVFMLSNAVGVNASVKFQSDSYKPDGADESISGTTLEVGAGITAFLW